MRDCTFRVAKTKVLISFAVTVKLVCIFGFAYVNCCFSHEAAQISGQKVLSFCQIYFSQNENRLGNSYVRPKVN